MNRPNFNIPRYIPEPYHSAGFEDELPRHIDEAIYRANTICSRAWNMRKDGYGTTFFKHVARIKLDGIEALAIDLEGHEEQVDEFLEVVREHIDENLCADAQEWADLIDSCHHDFLSHIPEAIERDWFENGRYE